LQQTQHKKLLGEAFLELFLIKIYALMKGNVDYTKISYLIFLASIMNCLLWFIFGIQIQTLEIYLCNAIGGVINIIYIIIFWYFFGERNFLKFIGLSVATLAILFGIFELLWAVIDNPDVSQYSAMVFNVIMYAAPGQKIFEVFKTEKYELIPIESSIIGFLCSTCWFIYGAYGKFVSIMVPNGLGIIFSLIQIICWIYYYRKAKNETPQLQKFLQNPDHANKECI